SSGTPAGRRVGMSWNLLGLTDFAVAIAMGILSSPGPLQVFALDHPNVQVGTYPTVMIPAFGVPSSIILHGLSLWQLRRRARQTALHTQTAWKPDLRGSTIRGAHRPDANRPLGRYPRTRGVRPPRWPAPR